MIKNKRLSSMFALFSACSLMTVGFTSQAASLQPEVKTAVSTKENIASEIQLNALQAVPANIVTSANSAVDEEVKRAAEEAARREQEAKEPQFLSKARRVLRPSYSARPETSLMRDR